MATFATVGFILAAVFVVLTVAVRATLRHSYVYTIIGLLTNLIRDLTYVWVDPRVKFFD